MSFILAKIWNEHGFVFLCFRKLFIKLIFPKVNFASRFQMILILQMNLVFYNTLFFFCIWPLSHAEKFNTFSERKNQTFEAKRTEHSRLHDCTVICNSLCMTWFFCKRCITEMKHSGVRYNFIFYKVTYGSL